MVEHQLYIFTFTFSSNIPESSLSSMGGKQNPPSVSNTREALGPMQQIINANNLTGSRPTTIHPSLYTNPVYVCVSPTTAQNETKKDTLLPLYQKFPHMLYGVYI